MITNRYGSNNYSFDNNDNNKIVTFSRVAD